MCCVEGRGCADGRCTALPRRDAGLFRGIVNCRPARRLDLAGFSSGTGVCARGGRSAGRCGSIAAVCRRFAHGIAVLLRWFALGLRMALRFCCGVLPRFTPVFFPLSGKKRRLAMSCVSIPPGRDRHSCVLAMSVWLSAFGRFTSGLCVSLWRSRRVTGTRGTGIRDTGTAARPLCAFVQAH